MNNPIVIKNRTNKSVFVIENKFLQKIVPAVCVLVIEAVINA